MGAARALLHRTRHRSGRRPVPPHLYNVGAQVDFQLKVQQRLPMTLSFGYAVGFDDDGGSSGEFMVSLKIL